MLTNKPFLASLPFIGAFACAIFFQGFFVEFLCLTLALIVIAVAWSFAGSYDGGIRIPLTALALCLTLYWIGLGWAAFHGRVAYVGTLSFCWLGSLPLVFWAYTLSAQRDVFWRHVYLPVAAIGVVLALFASCQWLIWGLEPRAVFLNRQSFAALLNLLGLSLCGYFLLGSVDGRKLPRWAIGPAIFALALASALIAGRGATLSGALALCGLLGAAWRWVPRRRIGVLLAIVAAAFLIGALSGKAVGERMTRLAENPWAADSQRTLIWARSWEMLQQSPWTGVGLGHYALYWPPYRDHADVSDGFFAHNDYLQIWIEAGLPGLLLLLAVLVATAFAYVRVLRTSSDPAVKIEASGLFAALLAVAVHSLVDFNLYILSILVLAGLMIARLHSLSFRNAPMRVVTLMPAHVFSRPGYVLLVCALTTLPLLYFATLGASSLEYKRGIMLAQTSTIDSGFTVLDRAERLYPYADNVTMSKADMLRQVLAQLPESEAAQKNQYFDEALRLLARAESLNPLRAQTHAIHARLLEENKDRVGAGWEDAVEREYRHAIAIDPRFLSARSAYANFLYGRGKRDAARAQLNEGLRYRYSHGPSLLPYLYQALRLETEAGNRTTAAALRERIDTIRSTPEPLHRGPLLEMFSGH